MKRKNKGKSKERAEPGFKAKLEEIFLESTCPPVGYIKLSESPEVKSGVEKIAEIISIMTIHLIENGKNGDKRVKNALSRRIDINPNKYMSRQLFISWIVQEMLLRGNAIVLPKINFMDGTSYIEDLQPIPDKKVVIQDFVDAFGYEAIYNNIHYGDDEILNFRFNPDLEKPWKGQGQKILLKDFIETLKQANNTTKDFMENKMLPTIVVKVSGMNNDMDSESGRETIEKRFLSRSKKGQPWIIPTELMQIEQIKPITLQDIAIDKTIKLSKESVASILGIPAFLLGVGAFNQKEYNNFIKTKISVICTALSQELTNKLLIRNDWYFRFNIASLLNYDLPELANVFGNLYTKGIVTGNEVRDKLGMSTLEGLDELVILENYIPKDKIGEQEKIQKGGDNGETI
ncbi:MAG: phage portal protein [Tissierellia bacterium]|nr:phage portal protein [Tissierellia bacterium]